MSSFVLGFQEIEKMQLSLVGGKGLNLGELSNIQGIQVPEGFCVTTVGYEQAIGKNEAFQTLLNQLKNAKKLRNEIKLVKLVRRLEKSLWRWKFQLM